MNTERETTCLLITIFVNWNAGFLMALSGSLLAMLVAFVLPCAFYLSILRGQLNKLEIAACLSIISVGVLCACIGTYSAIRRIAEQFS
uniref:Putative sodium-coupled neutral amino acid transporter 11 n=1 Tax=Rhizophora mucronata TaxID=61149 RepID=A0A2P2IT76_RHIMU